MRRRSSQIVFLVTALLCGGVATVRLTERKPISWWAGIAPAGSTVIAEREPNVAKAANRGAAVWTGGSR